MSILSLRDVVKQYHNHTAVDRISFEVPKGSIFGLLGPNGAGKTTLIRIITTITMADSGDVFLDGERINFDHPNQIGYMPEERGLYKKMKVGEQLLYLAKLKGMPHKEAVKKLRHWLEKFEILDWWNKKIEELSKGMQQKIQFIATVVHEPKLLILDEPFSGLDPINSNLIKDEIDLLNKNGTSIIFSTHRMEQVEEICENIALINNGRKILEGNVDQIKESHKENLFKIKYSGRLPYDFNTTGISIVSRTDHELVVRMTHGNQPNFLLERIMRSGVEINAFNEILPSLNEIFIKQVDGSNNTSNQ